MAPTTAHGMPTHKLVVLGDGGVGKTGKHCDQGAAGDFPLTIQLCLNHFVETYDPTIEDSYTKQVNIDGENCNLDILDTAGQEEYSALRDQWIRDGEGFLLVYSITSRQSFYRVRDFLKHIKNVKGVDDGFVPVMLVANKADENWRREVSAEEGYQFAQSFGFDFVETSAKTRTNVEKAFFNIVRSVRRSQEIETRIKTTRSNKRNEIKTPDGGKHNKECSIM
ncbi:Ras GTPase ras2 [Podochytrium sp. JEL0797]|nr:Ras GTPase ras2 [Podochytrium sp. JEL0797]